MNIPANVPVCKVGFQETALDAKRRKPQYFLGFCLMFWISLDALELANGGEGGIRTPDRLTPMSDFESGAFNRALPPLRAPLFYLRTSTRCIAAGTGFVDLS